MRLTTPMRRSVANWCWPAAPQRNGSLGRLRRGASATGGQRAATAAGGGVRSKRWGSGGLPEDSTAARRGPAASDELAVPAQDRGRGDQESVDATNGQ